MGRIVKAMEVECCDDVIVCVSCEEKAHQYRTRLVRMIAFFRQPHSGAPADRRRHFTSCSRAFAACRRCTRRCR